jgi:hypothetical protein
VIRADTTGLLSVLSEAVQAANLTALLGAVGPINVIAPVDTAFDDFFEEYDTTAEELMAETGFLEDLLRYHVVADGAVCVGEGRGTFPTQFDGRSVVFDGVSITDGRGKVANVILSVPASNGRLVIVDRVVMWPRDVAASDLEILLEAFAVIDTSGDGRVTMDEMIEAAAGRGVVLTDALLDQWIEEDTDGTGDLNFSEFTNTIWID